MSQHTKGSSFATPSTDRGYNTVAKENNIYPINLLSLYSQDFSEKTKDMESMFHGSVYLNNCVMRSLELLKYYKIIS